VRTTIPWRRLSLPVGLALAASLACCRARPDARVVFLTESAGFRHEVVARAAPGELSLAERALVRAAGSRFEVVATQDSAAVGRELDDVDALVLYTTGDLALDPDALVAWVRDGGALVGVHSASDTFRESEAFVAMLGGRFERHPWHQEVAVLVRERDHPATAHLPESFRVTDEIYELDSLRTESVRVLLELDPRSVDLELGDPERVHPLAWARDLGRGRVFYTALGHRAELWEDERFLRHVLGGIAWAGRLEDGERVGTSESRSRDSGR
jgi:type 1 glutamine amidotransferase